MTARRLASLVALLLLVVAGCAAPERRAERGIGGTGLDLGGGLLVQPEPALVDKGIGGTGITLAEKGIGGTGIVGTITGFGSVFVNGIEAVFGPEQIVTIDGAPASAEALRIGQIVQIEAAGTGSVVQSRRIDIVHEVIGPVAAIAADGSSLVVLGQSVALPAEIAAPKPGAWVAVSGLRRMDGTIIASRIDAASPGAALVAGPIAHLASGASAIGALPLAPSSVALPAGRRAIVSGVLQDGALAIAHTTLTPIIPFDGRLGVLSLETYVRLPSGASQRAILDLAVRPDGVALRHATFPAPAAPPAPSAPTTTAPAAAAPVPAPAPQTPAPPTATNNPADNAKPAATTMPVPSTSNTIPAATRPAPSPVVPAVPRPAPAPPPPPPPPRR